MVANTPSVHGEDMAHNRYNDTQTLFIQKWLLTGSQLNTELSYFKQLGLVILAVDTTLWT